MTIGSTTLLLPDVRRPLDSKSDQAVEQGTNRFNGGLAIPRQQVAELGLSKQSSAEAILADGRSVELKTFACFLDWFGNTYETQVAASDGEYPLLGTLLLDGRRLDIDYAAKTVELA